MASSSSSLEETQIAKILGTFISLNALALMAILLRFISRWLSRVKIWWDDYCACGMLFFFLASLAVDWADVGYGLGRHAAVVPETSLAAFVIANYSGEIIYPLTLSFIKSTILFLYLRLFGIDPTFRKITYGFLGLVFLWGISTTLVAAFQCQPVAAAYDLSVAAQGSTCIILPRYFVSTSIINVLIDVCILVLPLRPVWSLQLATGRKLTISFIFLLGTFTTAISIVRTVAVYTLSEDDPTWGSVPLALYSTLEIDTGIICACLPAMAPLLQTCSDRRSKYTGSYGSKTSRRPRVLQQNTSFARLKDESNKNSLGEPVSSANATRGSHPSTDLEMHNIYITNDVEVGSHSNGLDA